MLFRSLLEAVLLAFPDSVGRRRRRGEDEVVFARGGSGKVAPTSVVKEPEFLVVVDADGRRGRGVKIRAASAIEPEWLLGHFPDRIRETREVVFREEREGVEVVEQLLYEDLVLDEETRSDLTGEDVSAVLSQTIWDRELRGLCQGDDLENWRARIALAAEHIEGLEPLDDTALRAALDKLCIGARSIDDLRQRGGLEGMVTLHCGDQLALVKRLAPAFVSIPGRRRVPVHYEGGKPPWIESRLQDFFGAVEGPRVARGAVPLVLHLLAPNMRAVQVTTDLKGFWRRHYPDIRKSLRRRYHKHHWPEDPLAKKAPRSK